MSFCSVKKKKKKKKKTFAYAVAGYPYDVWQSQLPTDHIVDQYVPGHRVAAYADTFRARANLVRLSGAGLPAYSSGTIAYPAWVPLLRVSATCIGAQCGIVLP